MSDQAQTVRSSEDKVSLRTRLSYGLGCIGRDANYTLVSTFLMTYLTLAVGLTDWQLAAVGVVMIIARVWDAINDPMMGIIIDNTKPGRFGKFKPYIICGALLNVIFTILLFSNVLPARQPALFVLMFAITYILWGMTYTMNDISYWGILPSLTVNPKEREKVTSFARIGANIGLFAVTALVPMLTAGRMLTMYRYIAIGAAILFVACQVLVIVGVQEKKNAITQAKSHTRLRDMVKIVFKNDQLMAIVTVMLLFNIGYYTTTAFGVQFFYFDYGNYGGMEFTYFAITIGVAQILTLALYPVIFKNMPRRKQFPIALCIVVLGYLGFMLVGTVLPMNMALLIVFGFILFSGQAIIQLLTYVLLADTVEYGQWKLGTRNESVVFSLRPFIDKLSSALQVGIFSIIMIVSGLNSYSQQISALESDPSLTQEQIIALGNEVVQTIPRSSTLIMRAGMLILPLILILLSYLVYRKKYNMTEEKYAQIIEELAQRGEAQPLEEKSSNTK